MTTAKLPELIDHAGIMREMNVKRATADAIMQHLPKVTVPGVKKVYVHRAAVERLLEESTQNVVAKKPLRSVA